MKLKKSSYIVIILLLCITISLLFSITYIKKGEIGVFIPFSRDKTPKIINPGLAFHPPFFTRIIKYPLKGIIFEGTVSITSKEGAALEIPYEITCDIDPDHIQDLLDILASKQLNDLIQRTVTDAINPISKRTYLCSILEKEFNQEVTPSLESTLHDKGLLLKEFTIEKIELSEQLKSIFHKSLVYRAIQPTNLKVLLIGVDGADWKIIDTLIAQGKLPNFKKLKTQGAWGYLQTIRPMLSPLIWTSLITGKSPDIHGIIDFSVEDPETKKQVPITSTARKVKALWNILSDFNQECTIINWLASWPAETIRGNIVTDRVHYSLRKYEQPSEKDISKTFPPVLMNEVKPLIVKEEELSYKELAQFIHASEKEFQDSVNKDLAESRINHFRTILASTLTYHTIALRLLEEGQSSFFAIYYPFVDSAGHLFIKEMPPRLSRISSSNYAKFKDVVINVYQMQDKMIEDLLDRIDQNTIVIIVSDHGFISGSERESVVFRKGDIWAEGFHKINGVIILYGNIIKPTQLPTKSIYDITATILHLLGFPYPEDMVGEPIKDAFNPDFTSLFALRQIKSYEPINPLKKRKIPLTSADDQEIMENLQALGYLDSSSDSFTSHSNLASVYFHKQQYDMAEQEYKKALELRPDDISTKVRIILVYEKSRKLDRAIELHDDIMTSSKKPNPEIILLGVKLHLLANDIIGAENLLQRIDENYLTTKEIKTAQGLIKQHHKDLADAEQNFLEALQIDPIYYEPAERLIEIYLLTGNFEKAEFIINEALKLKEDSYLHHNLLGTVYYQKGDFSKAEQSFNQALQFSPDFLQAEINLGRCYFKTNKIQPALTTLSKALKSNPENYDVLVILGACSLRLKDYDKAIEHLNKALEVGPKTTSLYNALGDIYFAKKDHQAAEEMLKKSLALDKNQPLVRAMLQRISEAKKESLQ